MPTLHVLVTRPAHQSKAFCQQITQLGWQALALPLIEITPPSKPVDVKKFLHQLYTSDYAIFISANAVQKTFEILNASRPIPDALHLIAIGEKTANTLSHYGHPPSLVPKSGFTSEDLLKLPEMHAMQNKQVLIIRGEGGRQLLASSLQARDAKVQHSILYQRTLPEGSSAQLNKLLQSTHIDVTCITSGETLTNLLRITPAAHLNRIKQTPMIVGSQRIAYKARKLGFSADLLTADSPSDAAMLAALTHWATNRETL